MAGLVGREHVLLDPDVRAGYEVDWTRRHGGPSLAVVRPGSVDEVASLVRWCGDRGVAIVPQGGNTGLVGGSVPAAAGAPLRRDCVLLSTRRIVALRGLDLDAGQATVEAGITLGGLSSVLVQSGWEFGVDLGARDSATLGGMVATNAGGTRVLRYGSMRANLLGVEAVLGDGSVISHLDGLVKDNTGYDLAGLLCGSEGTLGIVTAARLRLVPDWPDRLAVAVACADWADAVALATTARRRIEGLDGLEAFDAAGARAARTHLGLTPPVGDAPVTLCIVWAGTGEPPDAFGEILSDRPHVAASPRRILETRDRQAEAIARSGIPHKLDVTLPLSRLTEFTGRLPDTLPAGTELYLFGHLGDGNLHVNVVGPDPDDPTVDDIVLHLVAELGGSISAEHGIGRLKSRWLHLVRSPSEISAMRAIKRALDPHGIMNPGVIFEGE